MAMKIGILGFAHGHVGAYLQQWRDIPDLGIQVVAGWDHDAARLEQAAKNHGLKPYGTAEDLLANGGVDAVVITSETSMHADLVVKAAAAGKAIVLQKPLALTLAQADRIVDAVTRSGVPFTMAWQMRVDPQNVRIRELIEGGTLGKVSMVRRRHTLSTHTWPGFVDWWHNKPEFNRDIFADDAAHAIDFIHWLLGAPESVTAELSTVQDPRVPNDTGIALYRYPSGLLAEVVGSFVATAGENTTEVTAEKGTVIQNYGDGPSCGAPRPQDAPGLKWLLAGAKEWTVSDIASPPGHGHRIAGLAAPIAEFLHGRRAAIATAEEGRTSLRMTLACYVSSREGRRVRLDDPAIAAV